MTVEEARAKFDAAGLAAWAAYSADYVALVPKARRRSVAYRYTRDLHCPAGVSVRVSCITAKQASTHLALVAPAHAAHRERLQGIRDDLLADMRAALPGVDIPGYAKVVRRSRYWEMGSTG